MWRKKINENEYKFAASVDLNECIHQINSEHYTFAPISELPANISTMIETEHVNCLTTKRFELVKAFEIHFLLTKKNWFENRLFIMVK